MRRTALVTCLLILATSLAGCGGGGGVDSGSRTPTGTVKQAGEMHVYRQEEVSDAIPQMEYVNGMFEAAGRIYLSGNVNDPQTGYKNALYAFTFTEEGKAEDVVQYEIPMLPGGSVDDLTVGEDGSLYAIVRAYDYGEFEMEEEDSADASTGSATADEVTEEAADASTGSATADEVTEETAPGMTDTDDEAIDSHPEATDSHPDATDADPEATDADPEATDADPEPVEGPALPVIALDTPPLPDLNGAQEAAAIAKFSPEGALLFCTPIEQFGSGDSFYVNNIAVSGDSLFLSQNADIARFSAEDGSFLGMTLEGGENGWLSLMVLRDQRVLLSGHVQFEQTMQTIDPATGKIEASFPLPNYYGDSMVAGVDYDVYFTDATGLFGMNLGDRTATELMNFVDSDMTGADFRGFVVLEDGLVLASVSMEADNVQTAFGGYSSTGDGETVLLLLTRVDPSEIQEKDTITLGMLYNDSRVTREVVKFNRERDDVRIRIITYLGTGADDDYETAQERFNTDIISGNMPDIVIPDMSMPLAGYFSKGVFEPLDDYLEKEPSFERDAFLTNILDAMQYRDRTYLLTPGFSVITMAMRSSRARGIDAWTPEAFQKLIDESGISYENLFEMEVTPSMLLQYFLMFNASQFIDYSNARCHFDGEEFTALLELAAKFPPEDESGSYDWEKRLTALHEDQSLFLLTGIGDFDSYWQARYLNFGDDITLIGFPTTDGKDTSSFMADMAIAMSASSPNKEICWEFMKRFYEEDFQDSLEYNFPVRRSSLSKLAEKAMTPETWYNPETGEYEEQHSTWGMGSIEVEKTPLTQEDVDAVMALFESLHTSAQFNEQISEIVLEEAEPFFKGQKSAAEVAGVIQSRVQIYLSENS